MIYKCLYAYENLLNIINVREIQFKTTTGHDYTSIIMVKIKNKTDYTKFWQGYGETISLVHCW